mgnify:CR=1 FL=1
MTTLMVSNVKVLNDLHQQIEGKLRSTVQDAIRAGELLTQAKDDLPHGAFLPWIDKNCMFGDKTAERYMKVFEHKGKIVTVSNLPEAYRQVKQIESVKKQTENQKAFKRVQDYVKSGVKPEGWRKNTDDKLYQEEQDRDERIRRFKERVEADKQAKESKKKDYKQDSKHFNEAISKLTSRVEERETFKEQIRISSEGKENPFIDALIDYLQGLDDDNRRLEACHNIIKVAKSIAKELDRKVYLEPLNEN